MRIGRIHQKQWRKHAYYQGIGENSFHFWNAPTLQKQYEFGSVNRIWSTSVDRWAIFPKLYPYEINQSLPSSTFFWCRVCLKTCQEKTLSSSDFPINLLLSFASYHRAFATIGKPAGIGYKVWTVQRAANALYRIARKSRDARESLQTVNKRLCRSIQLEWSHT